MEPRRIAPVPAPAHSLVRSQAVVGSVHEALTELVANSLDAGASEINAELRLEAACLSLRVADNGGGIRAASMPLLGQRFASSKHPGSGAAADAPPALLGYRGEALAALREAAAAVEVTSRAAGCFETHTVTLRGGTQPAAPPALAMEQRCRQGTVVTVRGLFANQPVRLKALLTAG